MDDDELRSLVESVVHSDAPEPFGTYLFGPDDPGAELGRYLERVVFGDSFGNTPELLTAEYGPYERTSVYFCVVDHRRLLPAGMVRIVLPTQKPGLKSFEDMALMWGTTPADAAKRTKIPLPVDRSWDWATLAVHPEYRGKAAVGLVTLALYRSIAGSALASGVDWLVAILDVAVQDKLVRHLHGPFQPYSGLPALPYLGSPASLPVWCHITGYKERLTGVDDYVRDVIFDGAPIAAAVRLLDLDDATETVRGTYAALGGPHQRTHERRAGRRHTRPKGIASSRVTDQTALTSWSARTGRDHR